MSKFQSFIQNAWMRWWIISCILCSCQIWRKLALKKFRKFSILQKSCRERDRIAEYLQKRVITLKSLNAWWTSIELWKISKSHQTLQTTFLQITEILGLSSNTPDISIPIACRPELSHQQDKLVCNDFKFAKYFNPAGNRLFGHYYVYRVVKSSEKCVMCMR